MVLIEEIVKVGQSVGLNETGIILEILGAGLMVCSAFRTRRLIHQIEDTWDAELSTKLRDVIANQAWTELFGFGLLASGLILQLLGALGY